MAKFPKTLLLVSSVKIQYARDDEGPHSCINHNKNIDNDLYCSSNEFPSSINYDMPDHGRNRTYDLWNASSMLERPYRRLDW